PAGIYDVYAERVFYDDAIEYQIEVVEGELTQLDIPMYEIVSVVEPIVPNSSSQISNLSNYPNPFNPSTTISFSIQYDIKAELSIFNIKGQKITTLINEHLSKGKHSIVWSGKDQNGNFIGSGIYLYKIKVGKQESVKRMLLLK
ncbi:MAG: T9SS type A sorting domain-containing protein, partial [Candidatus Cloacimonetes bacterium]|nr:T9SS type A sorting domain-containing protein [Candidatus Cloacimonadota bacterium]